MHLCRRFLAALASSAALASLLAACASAGPPTHLYSLMPVELAPRSTTVAPGSTPIVLEPIRLPAQVDQPQWLVRLPDGSLAALEQERWASPLRDEFRQALLEGLATRAGAVEGRAAAAGSAPSTRVGLDVRRFDSIVASEARIEGSWTLQASVAGAPLLRCEWLYRTPAAGGIPALAVAHRRNVVRLADAIGDGLLALRAGKPFTCPATDPP